MYRAFTLSVNYNLSLPALEQATASFQKHPVFTVSK